jgi:hypothetical protein
MPHVLFAIVVPAWALPVPVETGSPTGSHQPCRVGVPTYLPQVDIVRATAAPPAVSIVVPLFNQGALLGDTLAAVAAQTFTDWEVRKEDPIETC